jgi:coenzyme F420-reducing hydrogenase delta subunit
MVNLSTAMGPQFAEIVTEMTAKIQEMGPNQLKTC